MFGTGSIYQYFNVFWVIGAVLPCILYAVVKYGGRLSWIGRTLHAPVMLGAMGWLPPATPLSFSTWGIVALIFNHFIKKRFHGWWRQYNYVTAAALDAGLIISTIVIFFAIVSPVSNSSMTSIGGTWSMNYGGIHSIDGALRPGAHSAVMLKVITNTTCYRLSPERRYHNGGATLMSTTRWYVHLLLHVPMKDLS